MASIPTATQSHWTTKLSSPTCSAIASDALAAVGDVTMVNEAKLVYIMIVVDVRLHFVVSNFENGHVSIVMSMIYVRFFRTRAFSLVTQVADGCCAAMLLPSSLGA